MLQPFPNLVKGILADLSATDYPVLNTRLFFSCWLAYAMDKSITSMQDLFKRLNNTGIDVDISTFSKASKHRDKDIFIKTYEKLLQQVKGSKALGTYTVCPIDSTTITLTSKLLWALGYSGPVTDRYQVKLFTCLNSNRGETKGSLMSFGDAHDYTKISEMTEAIPENSVGVMDRGFASLEYLKVMDQQVGDKKKYYVLRKRSVPRPLHEL
ncbi:transposase [Anthocerotibacter panamensis]|uniref:transposase n=1 Tax=Anthocerotibacter panamensis TaxID=2857077 RepID=UPI001C403482|nr:transposase [Anthocerotibacter panamensis]